MPLGNETFPADSVSFPRGNVIFLGMCMSRFWLQLPFLLHAAVVLAGKGVRVGGNGTDRSNRPAFGSGKGPSPIRKKAGGLGNVPR